MRVSVIVPTYMRPESLSRCLDALACQDRQVDEILVAVRHVDLDSQALVGQHGSPVRVVLVDRPGVIAAMNAGVDASTGNVVCLTDDDAQPRRNWISQMLATYATDPKIGAVGGRDWVYHSEQMEAGPKPVVGRVGRFGRVVGNHHVGVGPARDVDVLKGVNLSMRGDLLRDLRFDERLLSEGTAPHWELGLCLALRRMGYRVIYDPAIEVEHYPQPRVDDSRELGPSQVRAAAHNETLALLEHLPPMGRMAHLLWTTAVGTRNAPGLAQAARLLLSTGNPRLKLLLGNLTGRGLAVSTYLGSSDGKVPEGSGARRSSSRRSHTLIRPQRTTSGRRPTVALVAHDVHDRGGMERVCAEMIRRGTREFDFVVVSATLAPDLRPLVTDWIQVRVPPRPFPLKFVSFWLRAGRRVRSLDVDVVHTVGAIVPNRIDVAAIHFCHAGFISIQGRLAPPATPLIRTANTSVARFLALAAERWCYRPGRVRTFAAVSDGVRTELLRHYPGVKVQVTQNGVDLDRFHPDASARADLRRHTGLTDEPVAVFVGGDWDRKGLAIGIQALAEVRARGIDLRLWVVGAGDRDRFSALAQELGVASAVSFFGTRDDVERFLAAADMFILPSLYETFSLVGFEAAATGLPVVVTSVYGISDLVKDHAAGILVERNAESLASGLVRLVREPDLCRRLGQGALQSAQRYSWKASVAALTDLYQSLLLEDGQSRT
jgi:glycosyltransferase involved in cell wall biosynthesis/GT2 family glycosyltransferase